MKLLLVTSSISGTASNSRALAMNIVTALREAHPDIRVVERDVAADPLPHLTAEVFKANMTPPPDRSAAETALAAPADALIEELEAADAIVIAAPMVNFSIPSTLKAWIDHVARAGRTFGYTEDGPKGFLGGRKVFVAGSRGGVYSEGPAQAMDFHETYLRGVLGFLGLTDVTFIHAEGQAKGPEIAKAAMASARARASDLATSSLAA